MEEYYRKLGLEAGANFDAVQKAFRELAYKHHPDKTGSNAERFMEAREAYNAIKDMEQDDKSFSLKLRNFIRQVKNTKDKSNIYIAVKIAQMVDILREMAVVEKAMIEEGYKYEAQTGSAANTNFIDFFFENEEDEAYKKAAYLEFLLWRESFASIIEEYRPQGKLAELCEIADKWLGYATGISKEQPEVEISADVFMKGIAAKILRATADLPRQLELT